MVHGEWWIFESARFDHWPFNTHHARLPPSNLFPCRLAELVLVDRDDDEHRECQGADEDLRIVPANCEQHQCTAGGEESPGGDAHSGPDAEGDRDPNEGRRSRDRMERRGHAAHALS